MNDEPLKFSEIYSGMTLWDNEWQRTQKVLRVYLWEDMIANNPNRYFKRKPKKGGVKTNDGRQTKTTNLVGKTIKE